MWSSCVFIILLVSLKSTLIYGQFFRKDYDFEETSSSFYKINTLPKTWSEAKIKCVLEGANLFYPENEEEAMVVLSKLNAKQPQITQFYIGVADWNVQEIYESIDGRSISDIYNNWARGEPDNNNSNEGCVVMQKDGTLKDENCNNKYPFVCKKTLGTLVWNDLCNIPDPHYKYYKDLDRCYKFHLAPKNWTEAYIICNAEESYLAIINSHEEDQLLINITAEAPKNDIGGDYLRGAVHLGFHNMNGIWETIKGVPLDVSGFGGGWGYNQPDGKGQEHCGSMFYTGELNDIGCWQKMFFICEHEVDLRAFDIPYRFGNNAPNVIDV